MGSSTSSTRARAASLARDIAERDFDVLHCHDQSMLDLGVRVKRLKPGVLLVYDSHELFGHWPLNLRPGTGPLLRLKSRLVRSYSVWRERRNARHVDRSVTVNESIARELERGLRLARAPVVVRNVPPVPRDVRPDGALRRTLGISRDRRIVVCIGARLHPGTLNLEQVMRELEGRTDAALVLVAGDYADLQAHAAERGYRNVHFHPFVPPERLPSLLASCDVGLVPTWNRRDLSYWYALDNKLFDYVAAGIPVLATRQPEYLRVVEGHRIGVCVDPDMPGAYSNGLSLLFADHAAWATRVAAARDDLTWDNEKDRLLALYDELAAESAPRAQR